jgi:hypothetical protein
LHAVYYSLPVTRNPVQAPSPIHEVDSAISFTEPWSFSLRDDRYPGWIIELTFSEVRTLSGFAVRSDGNGQLTRRLVRDLPLGEYEQAAQRSFQEWEEYLPEKPARNDRADAAIRSFLHIPRPGRAGRPDEFYAVFAAAYVMACRESRAPIKALADQWHLNEQTVKNMVSEARNKRGLLSETKQGKGGGELTEKALAILVDTPFPPQGSPQSQGFRLLRVATAIANKGRTDGKR